MHDNIILDNYNLRDCHYTLCWCKGSWYKTMNPDRDNSWFSTTLSYHLRQSSALSELRMYSHLIFCALLLLISVYVSSSCRHCIERYCADTNFIHKSSFHKNYSFHLLCWIVIFGNWFQFSLLNRNIPHLHIFQEWVLVIC